MVHHQMSLFCLPFPQAPSCRSLPCFFSIALSLEIAVWINFLISLPRLCNSCCLYLPTVQESLLIRQISPASMGLAEFTNQIDSHSFQYHKCLSSAFKMEGLGGTFLGSFCKIIFVHNSGLFCKVLKESCILFTTYARAILYFLVLRSIKSSSKIHVSVVSFQF